MAIMVVLTTMACFAVVGIPLAIYRVFQPYPPSKLELVKMLAGCAIMIVGIHYFWAWHPWSMPLCVGGAYLYTNGALAMVTRKITKKMG
jgi:hypothetical protein